VQDAQNGPQPDPSEFEPEPEFTIGEDVSEPSRASTPKPLEPKEDTPAKIEDGTTEASTDAPAAATTNAKISAVDGQDEEEQPVPALPREVQAKLLRLTKLEDKYGQLLRAYKNAHARVQTIGPFEASLRENTPLTTIAEPGALVEYLNQLNLKGDMVMQELKRVTSDNEGNKKKLDGSEKDRADLRAEVKQLKEKLESTQATNGDSTVLAPVDTKSSETNDGDASSASAKSPTEIKSPTESIASRVPSFSLFSPKAKAVKSPPPKESEDFFSYDTEIPRLESELHERASEIESLKKEVTSLKGDLAVARESTEGMVQSLESATRELHSLRESADKYESSKRDLQTKIDELEKQVAEGQSRVSELEKQVENAQIGRQQAAKEHEQKIKDFDGMLTLSRENVSAKDKEIATLRERVDQKDAINKDLEDSLAMKLSAERQEAKKQEGSSSEKKISTMQNIMDALRTQLDTAQKAVVELKVELEDKKKEFASRPSTEAFGFLDEADDPEVKALNSKESVVKYLAKRWNLQDPSSVQKDTVSPSNTTGPTPEATVSPETVTSGAAKKKSKNKKKKGKGGLDRALETLEPDAPQKVSEDLADVDDERPPTAIQGTSADEELKSQIAQLNSDIEQKEATIQRLLEQLKDQEALQEEIETLRDDLLHQGEEHVEARDSLKNSQSEKAALQESLNKLEKELADTHIKVSSSTVSERAHSDLITQFEDLKTKSATLQTDLAAAEQLAAGRFKDITDLRELISKAQPELRSLRSEVAELRSTKDELKNKTGELSRLETRHEDIKAEMKGLSKRLGDKDTKIKELQQKLEQEASIRRRVEEDLSTAQSDLRYTEARKKETDEQAAQTSQDLAAAKEDSIRLKAKFTDLEEQLLSHNKLVAELREELSLKAALHTTSQSMVSSLREQTHELSTQAREASTRAESLEEELAEAQRMLSERTREGQTMRILLNQAENGAEAKIRDMKDRMEAALEERDRAEEDASLQSRRVMREVEDARAKARAASAELKQVQDERDELQDKQKDWKRKRNELEAAAEKLSADVTETKSAMDRLRQALDESERQIEDLEKQRNDVRKREDEARNRVEKLTSANKSLNDELKAAQTAAGKPAARPGLASPLQSSRTSLDSPSVRSATPTERTEAPTGPNGAKVDYVYLKNVLLQFLEQKDKSHQKQLVPVLGMLLHFDKKDEQKWMSAIAAR
jgi:chromosome segregation ATPase